MRRFSRWSVVFLVLFSLAACAAVQKREKELTVKYPEWSREVVNKVAHGFVEVGMTKEQVREALVMPPRYDVVTKGDRWHWVDHIEYSREDTQEFGMVGTFEHGRLAELKHFMYVPDTMTYIEWK